MNCSTLARLLFVSFAFGLFFNSGIAIAAQSVPFKATIDISEVVQPTTPPCVLRGDITGTGTATRLGNITASSVDCIVPAPDGSTFNAKSTEFTMIGANGDKLIAEYVVQLSLSTGVLSGHFMFKGGTGTFTNASGGGKLEGVEIINPATGTGTGRVEFTGTLTY